MKQTRYDKSPETRIQGFDDLVYGDREKIQAHFADLKRYSNYTLVAECYPGVKEEVCTWIADSYQPDLIIHSDEIFYSGDKLNELLAPNITEDRVRGVMFYGRLEDLIDPAALQAARQKADRPGRILIFGVGAGLIHKADELVYCDLARWEITLRYRAGMPNFRQHNENEDPLRKIKRGYFIEWRVADKRKMEIFDEIDWFLDTNSDAYKMTAGKAVRQGLKEIAAQPFRLVPYFDPGVWGGQWMKKVCNLDPDKENYAWSFDGVPEENSLYLRFGDVRMELPAMDLVLYQPVPLLGMQNYCRFGAEFPIRFDLLDTMDGQNLSLQVHPLTEFIRSHYGMTYTQDESYYILDAKEDGGVYLGLKDNVHPEDMEKDLYKAQEGGSFPVEKYINRFPAKKHDHFLIPAGTVHCSAANTVVLEISATPYNFTFKLFDWDRVGLDGRPRPIHIREGMQNIQWNRTTEWVKENLVNHVEVLHEDEDYKEERTGLHELEFIETRRITSCHKTSHTHRTGFHMCNLVDGEEAVIESPDHRFEPYHVHYAETFIIPWAAGDYTIRPKEEGQEIKVIQAYVRQR